MHRLNHECGQTAPRVAPSDNSATMDSPNMPQYKHSFCRRLYRPRNQTSTPVLLAVLLLSLFTQAHSSHATSSPSITSSSHGYSAHSSHPSPVFPHSSSCAEQPLATHRSHQSSSSAEQPIIMKLQPTVSSPNDTQGQDSKYALSFVSSSQLCVRVDCVMCRLYVTLCPSWQSMCHHAYATQRGMLLSYACYEVQFVFSVFRLGVCIGFF